MLVIMNFSGVYLEQTFYQSQKHLLIDCSEVGGTDCYCDIKAQETIAKKISNLPPEGIHFIDSGNYHYVTKFWTDKIKEPFALLVIDHHSDMLPPLFEEVLSCGGWVNDVWNTNPFVRRLVIKGEQGKTLCRDGGKEKSLPVYISLDKDILSPQYAHTNWDQGTMNLSTLENLIKDTLQHHRVIGMDVCGENVPGEDSLLNDEANKTILTHLESFC